MKNRIQKFAYDLINFIDFLDLVKQKTYTLDDVHSAAEFVKNNIEIAAQPIKSSGLFVDLMNIFQNSLDKDLFSFIFINLFPYFELNSISIIEQNPDLLDQMSIYKISYEFLYTLTKSNDQQILFKISELLFEKIKTTDINRNLIYLIFQQLYYKLNDKRLLYEIQQYLVNVLKFDEFQTDQFKLYMEQDVDIRLFEVIDEMIKVLSMYLILPQPPVSFTNLYKRLRSREVLTDSSWEKPITKLMELKELAIKELENRVKEAFIFNIKYYLERLFKDLPKSNVLINDITTDVREHLRVSVLYRKKETHYQTAEFVDVIVIYYDVKIVAEDLYDTFDKERWFQSLAAGFDQIITKILYMYREKIMLEYRLQKRIHKVPKEVLDAIGSQKVKYLTVEEIKNEIDQYFQQASYNIKMLLRTLAKNALDFTRKRTNILLISYLINKLYTFLEDSSYKEFVLHDFPTYIKKLDTLYKDLEKVDLRDIDELFGPNSIEQQEVEDELQKVKQKVAELKSKMEEVF